MSARAGGGDDRDWLDDELELSSEDLLAWCSGVLGPGERERVASSVGPRPELVDLARELAPARRARRPRPVLLASVLLVLVAICAHEPYSRWRSARHAAALFARGDFAGASAWVARSRGTEHAEGSESWSASGFASRAGSRNASGLAWVRPDGLCLDSRPVLAWDAGEGAGPFELRVEDADGAPVLSWRGMAHEVELPDAAPDLSAGASYRIVLRDLGRPRGDELVVLFTVADATERQRIERAVDDATAGVVDVALECFLRARELARQRVRGEARVHVARLFEWADGELRQELRRYLERNSAGGLVAASGS